jgi:hypothetical protein
MESFEKMRNQITLDWYECEDKTSTKSKYRNARKIEQNVASLSRKRVTLHSKSAQRAARKDSQGICPFWPRFFRANHSNKKMPLHRATYALAFICLILGANAAIQDQITNVFVIFLENNSFDHILSTFPGANNILSSAAQDKINSFPQKRSDGSVYSTLPVDSNNRFPANQPNQPFNLSTIFNTTMQWPSLSINHRCVGPIRAFSHCLGVRFFPVCLWRTCFLAFSWQSLTFPNSYATS